MLSFSVHITTLTDKHCLLVKDWYAVLFH